MDIQRMGVDLKFINKLGETLSVEEKNNLSIGLMRILKGEKIDDLQFWGRIRGVTKDYYIALGLQYLNQYEFPAKRFYWATSNNFAFSPLPPVIEEFADVAEGFSNMFTGNPENVLFKTKEGEDGEAPADDGQAAKQEVDSLADSEDLEEQRNKKVAPDQFKEIDRLAFVVRAIENDCAVVPCTAHKLTPTHELRVDDNFKGLCHEGVGEMFCYQHFRPPQDPKKKEDIMRDDAIFQKFILDPLVNDKPNGCWTVLKEKSLAVCLLNHSWPGFIAYHQANTNIYGYAYFGTGQKNAILPFLI